MLIPALLSIVTGSALAAAPAPEATPAWRWTPGQAELFHLETAILVPRGVTYYALNNLDARAAEVRVSADITCTPAPDGKKLYVVACRFDHLALSGRPWTPQEKADLDKILAEWTERLSKSEVRLTMTTTGRVREFDLGGLYRSNARDGSIIEQMRALLQRAFCLFDLQLPAPGDDWVRGWEEKGVPPLLNLMTTTGTVGNAVVKYTPKGEVDGLYEILLSAKATLSPGGAFDADSGSMLLDTRAVGSTLWELKDGLPAYRDLTIEQTRTASSNEVGSGAEYAQVSAFQHVEQFNPDHSPPLSPMAQRATQLNGTPPDAPDGVPAVAFADLGMNPLFLPEMPADGRQMQLPTTTIGVRVVVGADGRVESAAAYKGYAVLSTPVESALRAARFPVREVGRYYVDCDVEVRAK